MCDPDLDGDEVDSATPDNCLFVANGPNEDNQADQDEDSKPKVRDR